MSDTDTLYMVLTVPVGEIIAKYPVCQNFFTNLRIENIERGLPLHQALEKTDPETLSEFGLDCHAIQREFCDFLNVFVGRSDATGPEIAGITIIGGHGKAGEPEDCQITINRGETISIVGPTGSGKSRLLADIECLANCDTPTGRQILLDGKNLDDERRIELQGQLVAQLSQNMNFVIDLTVDDFLRMHAGSRHSINIDETVERCFVCANSLAGEAFSLDTRLTQLSGGQSRALMIADTAFMSTSPIVLIDEIENAGIDRRQAIELLASRDKIVIISTHDPLLALGADRRLIIKNGGISGIITTSEEEKACLIEIERLDARLFQIRKKLRNGEIISHNALG